MPINFCQTLLFLLAFADPPSALGAALHVTKSGGEEATFVVPENNNSSSNIFLNLKVGGNLNIGPEGKASTCSMNSTSKGKETVKESYPVVALALHESGLVDTLPIDKRALPLPSVAGRNVRNAFEGGAGGAVKDGTVPLFCGGRRGQGNPCTNQCYAYNPKTKQWSEAGRMREKRCWPAATVHPVLGLLITGGSGLSSVENTLDGKRFEKPLPNMPRGVQSHCQVMVDANTIMVFGGYTRRAHSETVAQQLDISKKAWKLLPSIPTGRRELGCGVVKVSGSPKKVIIAGGTSPKGRTDKVDVLDLSSLTWTAGIAIVSLSYVPF